MTHLIANIFKLGADLFADLALLGFFVATILRLDGLNNWQAGTTLVFVTFAVIALICRVVMLCTRSA